MGEFFLPPHVSNRETFFFGKDNFQLEKKKKKKFPLTGPVLEKKNFFFLWVLKIVFAKKKCFAV